MDKPADYGSAFRGSNPLGGTSINQKQSVWTAFGIFRLYPNDYIINNLVIKEK